MVRATGYPMTSFRAEAFGRWDALRWLRRHLSEGALPWNSLRLKVQSYTDSESLIKLEQKMVQPWFRWTPTLCLKGDYDILHLLTDGHQESTDPTVSPQLMSKGTKIVNVP